jgi:hypothetical protein
MKRTDPSISEVLTPLGWWLPGAPASAANKPSVQNPVRATTCHGRQLRQGNRQKHRLAANAKSRRANDIAPW